MYLSVHISTKVKLIKIQNLIFFRTQRIESK